MTRKRPSDSLALSDELGRDDPERSPLHNRNFPVGQWIERTSLGSFVLKRHDISSLHHWNDRLRRPYPIDDFDLSVLETQAKGGLGDFTRWHGCARKMLACPFFYLVTRQGQCGAVLSRAHEGALPLWRLPSHGDGGVPPFGAVRENRMTSFPIGIDRAGAGDAAIGAPRPPSVRSVQSAVLAPPD